MSFDLIVTIHNTARDINSARDVSDALDKVFTYKKDFLTLFIDNYQLNISLVYGFSDLLDDFLGILEGIDDMCENDQYTFGFSQNDFFDADWVFTPIANGQMEMKFTWRSSDHMKFPKDVCVDTVEFVEAWKVVLREMISHISDISFEYPSQYRSIIQFLD